MIVTFYSVLIDKLIVLAAFRVTVKEHGRLDIVVNNAAIMDERDWERTLNVNLVSVKFVRKNEQFAEQGNFEDNHDIWKRVRRGHCRPISQPIGKMFR